jgi:hypothetical protein
MLSFPLDPAIFSAIENFIKFRPVRGQQSSFRRTEYKTARLTFLNEVTRLKLSGKITNLGRFVRAVYVLQINPTLYAEHHRYVTRYQILKLAGEAGTVSAKVLNSVFRLKYSPKGRKALLEIEAELKEFSGSSNFQKQDFDVLSMRYY